MGTTSWNPGAWDAYASSTRSKRTEDIFTSTSMKDALNPRHIKVREARDSAAHPESTPFIVGVDVTGSMGELAENLVREGTGTLMTGLLKSTVIRDPSLMAMAIGDVKYDSAPLQVTQFESDLAIAKQLEEVWIEGGGGNNDSESYHLPWYFAATKVSTDSFEKRGKKGYLFTVGDELPPPTLTAAEIFKVTGENPQRDFTLRELLTMAERSFHVIHLVVARGSYCRSRGADKVMAAWREVMGQNVLLLEDHKKLAEVIISAAEVVEGVDHDVTTKRWSGDTALVVARAVSGLAARRGGATGGVVRL